MVHADDLNREAERLRALYEAKARAEIADADALLGGPVTVASHGDPLARVLAVKGVAGPADAEAGLALAGEDGEALAKALAALGADPTSLFSTCARSGPGEPARTAARLGRLIEAVDPRVVIALDAPAAADLGIALGVRLPLGRLQRVRGRVLLAVDEFEASLADESSKRRVWRQLRSLREALAEKN